MSVFVFYVTTASSRLTLCGMSGLRPFLNSTAEDSQFCHKQKGEQGEENEERSLYSGRVKKRDGSFDGQQILNSPRLTAHFGHNPACLSCHIDYGDTPKPKME